MHGFFFINFAKIYNSSKPSIQFHFCYQLLISKTLFAQISLISNKSEIECEDKSIADNNCKEALNNVKYCHHGFSTCLL